MPSEKAEEAREIVARNVRFDIERGRVEFLGARFLLVQPEFLVAIQKQLEATVGASAKGILYLAGERSGQDAPPPGAELLLDVRSKEAGKAILRGLSEVGALRGLGRVCVTEFDPENLRFRFRIDEGALPEAYGPSKKPVCHVWAGWAAGIAKRLFGREVLCEEVTCRAAGAPTCEFALRPRPGR